LLGNQQNPYPTGKKKTALLETLARTPVLAAATK
jgi:hypothetical protein